ncbi:MAG: hypothetical protein ACI4NG_01805 [Candidatus Gallimonas sp.]
MRSVEEKTCCFIGHRKIDITIEMKKNLTNLIEKLIKRNNVLNFIFGSRSEFDDLCYAVVTELKNKYKNIRRIAYTCKSEYCILENEREYFEKLCSTLSNKKRKLSGYEEEYEHDTKYVANKASYIERNQAMIDNSDYCIFYYNEDDQPLQRNYSENNQTRYQSNSGTKIAYRYAKKKNKRIINIFTQSRENEFANV